MMKFRHLIWMSIAASGLILSAAQSQAQTRQPDVGDQPGLIADDSVELDPQFKKTAVLYRTSEPPGTIIISTKDRHLYLVQGGGRQSGHSCLRAIFCRPPHWKPSRPTPMP